MTTTTTTATTTSWTCSVQDCSSAATAGWGSDVYPPVDVCSAHLDELAGGALALHTDRGRTLIVKPLGRGTL